MTTPSLSSHTLSSVQRSPLSPDHGGPLSASIRHGSPYTSNIRVRPSRTPGIR